MLQLLFGLLLTLTSIFLILLVLVQRGRGGGLAGALGGMGGQSAFGAKAGDTFTKITIWAATFWILLCMASIIVLNPAEKPRAGGASTITTPPTSGAREEVPADRPSTTTPGATSTPGASSTTGANATEGAAKPSDTATESGAETNTDDTP